jgi:23S rRNA (uracil1939-C5)-methyltransferase
MEYMLPYVSSSNLKQQINGKKLERYRNNIIFTIGYSIENYVEVGPLQLDKSVKSARSNIVCSELAIEVCETFKLYLLSFTKLPIFHHITKKGFWRHIQIRENTLGEYLINFRVYDIENYQEIFELEKDKLVSFLSENISYKLLQINYQIIEGKREPTVDNKLFTLYNEGPLYENMLGIKFIIHPLCFFQVNYEIGEILFSIVRELVVNSESTKLIDLCCGIGIYSLICSDLFSSIQGIDCNPYNIMTANTLKKLNPGSNHCEFICGKVEKYMESLIDKEDYTLIINPGRSGLPLSVCHSIFNNRYKFQDIIYISCNGKSLKRDLDRLQIDKSSLKKIIPVNIFPNTKHIEFICLF